MAGITCGSVARPGSIGNSSALGKPPIRLKSWIGAPPRVHFASPWHPVTAHGGSSLLHMPSITSYVRCLPKAARVVGAWKPPAVGMILRYTSQRTPISDAGWQAGSKGLGFLSPTRPSEQYLPTRRRRDDGFQRSISRRRRAWIEAGRLPRTGAQSTSMSHVERAGGHRLDIVGAVVPGGAVGGSGACG